MRFHLVDRIQELEPNSKIVTVKNLTMAEEYLAEHFPSFPVMPGVLMIEAITQTGAWLIRLSEQFAHSVILLKEAKNVRFGQFVTPGKQLKVTCEIVKDDGVDTLIKAHGELDGVTSLTAKVVLTRFNLVDRHPVYRRQDQRLKAHLISMYHELAIPEVREKLMNNVSSEKTVTAE